MYGLPVAHKSVKIWLKNQCLYTSSGGEYVFCNIFANIIFLGIAIIVWVCLRFPIIMIIIGALSGSDEIKYDVKNKRGKKIGEIHTGKYKEVDYSELVGDNKLRARYFALCFIAIQLICLLFPAGSLLRDFFQLIGLIAAFVITLFYTSSDRLWNDTTYKACSISGLISEIILFGSFIINIIHHYNPTSAIADVNSAILLFLK